MYDNQPTSRELILQRALHRTYTPAMTDPHTRHAEPVSLEIDDEPELMLSLSLVVLWTLTLVVSALAIHLWLTGEPALSERFEVKQSEHGIVLIDLAEGDVWRMTDDETGRNWVAVPNELDTQSKRSRSASM